MARSKVRHGILRIVVLVGFALMGPWPVVNGSEPVDAGLGGTAYGWHTFYGSSGFDRGRGIALDGGGNVYVVGQGDTWNGPDGQLPLHSHDGPSHMAVLKLEGTGAYQWHTFYGFIGRAVGVDGNGNVYVTGSSTESWAGPGGQPPLHAHSEVRDDIVVLKLDSSGAYLWHTFHDAGGGEDGSSITVDDVGNVYVAGVVFQATGGYAEREALCPKQVDADITVLKLDSDGAYLWQTFHGSNLEDAGWAITVDGNGVYVAGYSVKSWFGPEGQPPIHGHSGDEDFVVLKLDSSGAYQWHTFFGSAGTDYGHGIATDSDGYVYVTGTSRYPWTGPRGAEPVHSHSGQSDMAVLKLHSTGAFRWHTFHGSNLSDGAADLATDGNDELYVAGYSTKPWNGPAGQPPLHTIPESNWGRTAVLKLSRTGAYRWHSFYGSNGEAPGRAIALDDDANPHIAGDSSVTWNGPGGEPPLHAFGGNPDIHVLKIQNAPAANVREYLPLARR